MTPEQIHQFLIRTKGCQQDLNNRNEKMQEIRSLAEKVTPSYDFVPIKSHGGSYSRVEHYAIELVSMQEEFFEYASKALELLSVTLHLIELVQDPVARAVLTEYYVSGMTAEETAADLDYYVKSVYRIIRGAHKEIAEALTPSLYAAMYEAAPDIVLQPEQPNKNNANRTRRAS